MNAAIETRAGAGLPEGFEKLESVAAWSLRTETERIMRRQASSFAQIAEFRDTVLPELPRIFDYLNARTLGTLSPTDENLLFLTLSLAEIAPAVEFYRQAAVIEGFDALRFLPVENFCLRPKR
ncbi:MAG: hypothetical protein ACYDBZ_09500 [Steroidobacteraceae bacterium]